MKRFVYIFIISIFILGNSCQNDDLPNSEEKEQAESENNDVIISKSENYDLIIPDSIIKMMIIQDLLATFCHVDTINDSTFSYRSKYGHQDEVNPTTYLFKATSEKDAYSFFMHLIPYKERNKILEIGNTFSYSIDDKRTIKYTYIGSSEMKAMIEFEIPEIPEIKRYIYLPDELWPYNDSVSPFSLGSIWNCIKNNQIVGKYICVKEYAGRNDRGILMTFGIGGKEIPAGSYNNNVPFLIDCASKWAWQKLEDLYENYPKMFNDAIYEEAIPRDLKKGSKYTVGGIDIQTWTTGALFWKETHYKYTVHNVMINNGKFKFEDFSWDSSEILTSRSNMNRSSHIEFGNTMPSGEWEQISY